MTTSSPRPPPHRPTDASSAVPCPRCAVSPPIRGRTYRDALIMLEFMPYRSTDRSPRCLPAVANAEHNLGLDPASW